ncbi:MAG: alpha/beta hydrolase fold domain-containing protein [Bacteroides graminisolvens]|nr:alpha/beta hydrolase fold domain-containing protein [Bacteroides graminisolvens]
MMKNRLFICMSILFLFSSLPLFGQEEQPRFTVMGLGDSITEGGSNFSSYLYPLWEKLFSAGYEFDFVGPRESLCRIGKLAHCGFGGKNIEFLESITDSIYRKYPSDFVLIHAGHNHSEEDKPIAGMIKAYQSIIHKLIVINPKVCILLAKVIPSGKLPKYSYIPELNRKIEMLVDSMRSKQVILVDQYENFDWKRMTIQDYVHPNDLGREHMASVWFDSLRHQLKEPPLKFKVELCSYKALSMGDSLKAHIFRPKKDGAHAAILYFFAGGWTVGSPLQFYRECSHYAARGMVAISFDYRISYLYQNTREDAFQDAKDAVRWVREHAKKLGIDPARIVVAGASAGGGLATMLGCIDKDSAEKQSRPNSLVLYYPVVSYLTNMLHPDMPPILYIIGSKDEFTPRNKALEFCEKVRSFGNICEFHLFENCHHPIFYYRKPLTNYYDEILSITDEYLKKQKYF